MPDQPTQPPFATPIDLEVKDPQLIFDAVWRDLEAEFGRQRLCFPKEIFWLNGAPGAGKGTQTELIRKYKDLTATPIAVSSLLTSPEARRLIDAGQMASDKEVTYLVLRKLLEPQYTMGALVDGFPRTRVQVEILKLFFERLKLLRREMHGEPEYEKRYPKPHFRIVVLYIDEAESIRRQLKRGEEARAHNSYARESGVGHALEVRSTDLDPELARKRYKTFKEVTYESLKSLTSVFDYHFIDAHGSVEQVRQRIEDELAYQSSLELEPITYDRISHIPIATEVMRHARQELVARLDSYTRHNSPQFTQVIELIDRQIIPTLRRQALTGLAVIPITSQLLTNELAQTMLVDIFAERGYRAVIYNWSRFIPDHFDLETGEIFCRQEPTYRVEIRFQPYEVRRA
jgi:adenylate kinase